MAMTAKAGGKVTPNMICCKCGIAYTKRAGNFYPSYAPLYRGTRTLHICKECTDKLYEQYLSECENPKAAVRQLCRKLDLYWSGSTFDKMYARSNAKDAFADYIGKISGPYYAGKSYDDTLKEEGVLWRFERLAEGIKLKYEDTGESVEAGRTDGDTGQEQEFDITKEVVDFWGAGLTPKMYRDLEQRKRVWLEQLQKQYPDSEIDIGQLALLRQICNLELEINSDKACGRPIDKNINALNTLIGSANLKPKPKKSDDDANLMQPMGVWLDRYEHFRPLPDIDENLKDKLGIIRYISIWFKGHITKMFGIRNSYSQLYEDEMAKYRVEKPEYDGEDDDEVLYDILNGGDTDGEDEV